MKSPAGTVGAVVQSVVLGMSVLLLGFTVRAVYDLNAEMAAVKIQLLEHKERIVRIEVAGSPAVQAITVRLDMLTAGQARIEKALENHMSSMKP